MATRNLIYQRTVPVPETKINIVIPFVGEIVDNESEYYDLVGRLTAMPIDMMVQLDDAGIDFTEIDEYQLFLMMFGAIKGQDTSLVFGDLDLGKFGVGVDEDDGSIVLIDTERDIKINRKVHGQIASILRKIHHLEKNRRKPANEDAKKYMIERARKKMNRRKGRTEDSHLESLIVAMVNTEQFKYDFERTRELSIYQFNESVRQIIKKVDYDNRMYGVYAGTISAKDLNPDDLNWLTHK